MDEEKDDTTEEPQATEHEHAHEGDFAEGQEKKEHDEDGRGTFATGESKEPTVPVDAPKGFFAEGEAKDEEEDLKRKGTFGDEEHKH